MTQTITKCNEVPTGTRYLVSHLRTAASIEQLCEYVDAGHPLAWSDGGECKLLQRRAGGFNAYRLLKPGKWQHQTIREDTLTHFVKLAPLAYKDGRPLHVGDKFSVGGSDANVPIDVDWIRHIVAADSAVGYKGILPVVGYKVILH